jgi:hypothetical protein
MEIYGDLDFKDVGQLISAALKPENPEQFPDLAAGFAAGTIKQGRFAFFNNRVWIAVALTADGSPSQEVATWIPITNEITAYTHIQANTSTQWTVPHNLQEGTPVVQVYDANNEMVIPVEIIPVDANNVTIDFNVAVSGRAIILTGNYEGTSRSDGAQQFAFEHEQTVASTTWVIGHGLGYYPIVRVFTPSGSPIATEEILPASIVHDSVMQVTITFSTARTGTARLV